MNFSMFKKNKAKKKKKMEKTDEREFYQRIGIHKLHSPKD